MAPIAEHKRREIFAELEKRAEELKTNPRLSVLQESPALTVWLVDGKATRDNFNIDFIGGGHHWRYPWIPGNEIWIEEDVPENERLHFLIHELHERNLMVAENRIISASPQKGSDGRP